MSAPLFPEHHSCMSCGGHLSFAERRQPEQTCAACVKERRARSEKARHLQAIIEVVTL